VGDVAALLEKGQLNRKIGETMMNSESSRSHSVFTAVLECKSTDDTGITHVLSSRLNLVDLAGASLRHTQSPHFALTTTCTYYSVCMVCLAFDVLEDWSWWSCPRSADLFHASAAVIHLDCSRSERHQRADFKPLQPSAKRKSQSPA